VADHKKTVSPNPKGTILKQMQQENQLSEFHEDNGRLNGDDGVCLPFT